MEHKPAMKHLQQDNRVDKLGEPGHNTSLGYNRDSIVYALISIPLKHKQRIKKLRLLTPQSQQKAKY